MASKIITQRQIDALKVGQWLTEPAPRRAGALQVRKLAGGSTSFYFRYTDEHDKRRRLSLGRDIPLVKAREIAAAQSTRYQTQDRNLHEAIQADKEQKHQLRVAREAAVVAEEARRRATLGVLLTAYVAQLERDRKPSAKAVKGALSRHVEGPWPALWAQPANDVTTGQLVEVLSPLTEERKYREAEKLRSYFRAAYTLALRAKQDARASRELRELHVTVDPARDLMAIHGSSGVRERALTEAELHAYWKRIAALPAPTGPLLRFHLLTGGQRIEQLARVTQADYSPESKVMRMLDPKGRRAVGRVHEVPVIPAAEAAMHEMGQELGQHIFTITHGQTGADASSLHRRIAAVAESMAAAGELTGPVFAPSDIRRTVETRLAALGVSKEIRGQLQSHGLSGVQDRHYDRHDYLIEKRTALEKLYLLASGAADVESSDGARLDLRLVASSG